MRCVLDTNVIVSAVLSEQSTPGRAVLHARKAGALIATFSMLTELMAVLRRRRFDRYVSAKQREEFFRRYIHEVEIVIVTHSLSLCRDPRDDRFLEAAASGSASHIITGDSDLLALNPFCGVRIVTPSEFLSV